MKWDMAPISASVAPLTTQPIGNTDPIYVKRDQVIRTPKCGARGQFTGSNATLYTAPSVTSPTGSTQGALLKSIILCNTDTAARTVTMYVVESGGSAAANRMILSVMSIAASTTVTLTFPDEVFPMDSGETVQGFADTTTKVTYRINVVELT
jgi:hypothetical protein